MCLPSFQEELDRGNILEVIDQQWIVEEPAAEEAEAQAEQWDSDGWDEDDWDRRVAEELARRRENPE